MKPNMIAMPYPNKHLEELYTSEVIGLNSKPGTYITNDANCDNILTATFLAPKL